MALAWAQSRPFSTSVICGATTLEQLAIALGAADIELGPDITEDIAAAYRRFPVPF
jgi:aryl-alcohol dehydrogenase-like predicted oxidoreductase